MIGNIFCIFEEYSFYYKSGYCKCIVISSHFILDTIRTVQGIRFIQVQRLDIFVRHYRNLFYIYWIYYFVLARNWLELLQVILNFPFCVQMHHFAPTVTN